MGENQILVAIKKPGELPGLEPLFENSLEAFQKAVGTKGEGFASIRGSAVPAILKLLNGRDCR